MKPNLNVGFLHIYSILGERMTTIKESQLKEIFEAFDLDEGIFDIFKKMRISKLEKEVDDIIKSAPTQKQKDALRNLSNAMRAASAAGVFNK